MNQSNLIKISIIVPSYNQAPFLSQCLDSIFSQNHQNIEVIVMDGGSSDNSINIIKKFEEKLSYWQSKCDNGQSDAINQGIAKSTGQLVTWLNSDDYLLSNSLYNMAQAFYQNPDAAFYYGNGLRVDKSGKTIETYYPSEYVFFQRSEMIFSLNRILQPATFINRKVVNVKAFLDEKLNFGLDTDLWIRLAEKGRTIHVPKLIAASREYADTKTASGTFKRVEELRQIAAKYSDFDITPGGICYMLHALHEKIKNYPNLYQPELIDSVLTAWNETKHLLDRLKQNYATVGADYIEPKVTLIFYMKSASYDAKKTLAALDNQTNKNFECKIITDDIETLKKQILLKNSSIHYLKKTGNSLVRSYNYAIHEAKGEIISFIKPGDDLDETYINTLINYFYMLPQVQMIYGPKNNNSQSLLFKYSSLNHFAIEGANYNYWWAFRKSIIKFTRSLDVSLNTHYFFDLILKFFKHSSEIHLINELLIEQVNNFKNPQTIIQIKEKLIICSKYLHKTPLNHYYEYWEAKHQNPGKRSIALPKIFNPRNIAQLHYAIKEKDAKTVIAQSIPKILKLSKFIVRYLNINDKNIFEKFKEIYNNRDDLIIQRHALKIPEERTGKPLLLPKKYFFNKTVKKAPKISIVTPSFNQGNFIERTLNSVLIQNYPNLEYIVQDGGSSDNTISILEQYASKLKHWESKKDNGQSHAINLGFKHATGEIMAYLNSDDLLLPGSLNYIAEYFNKHPDVDVVYGHRILINGNDYEIGRWTLPKHCSKVLEWADFVPQETLFWRRTAWEKAGGCIDESFKFAMDWDLIMRLLDSGANMKRLPRYLGAFRIHQQQKTLSFITETGYQEMDRIRRRIHNKRVTDEDIHLNTRLYFRDQALYHMMYKLKLKMTRKKVTY